MRLAVFGSGYVGLVTGACLAEVGNQVICVDVDERKVAALKAGQIPIHEPGLDALVGRNAAAGRLHFSSDGKTAILDCEAVFIAVGTPSDEDGSADLSHVLAVAREIGRHLPGYRVVIDKSTVPVGTADRVAETIRVALAERGVSHDFDVVSNPEFLKEGAAVADFMKPDRVVVGTDSPRALGLMRALYAPFTRNHERLIVMDARSAELTKYAANAMLATRISFMNELAGIAERVRADIEKVRQGIGSDSRIGFSFIYPGAGYGGSCFPKDVKALCRTAAEAGANPRLLNAVEAVNESQKDVLFQKLSGLFGSRLSGMTVALWGLAFKPNTDDMREAPSRRFMEAAWAAGVRVRAYDPVAMREAERLYPRECASGSLTLCRSPLEAVEGAEALVIVTEWQEFRSPDFEALKARLKQPVILDGRNLYDPDRLKSLGFKYFAIGRGERLS
jgi:UDPglucose 6-dehydrogenase